MRNGPATRNNRPFVNAALIGSRNPFIADELCPVNHCVAARRRGMIEAPSRGVDAASNQRNGVAMESLLKASITTRAMVHGDYVAKLADQPAWRSLVLLQAPHLSSSASVTHQVVRLANQLMTGVKSNRALWEFAPALRNACSPSAR